MTTTTQPRATLATRFGCRAGALVRNARIRVARFEANCVVGVEATHGASGAVITRAAFLIGKVALVVLTLAVSVWLAVTILTLVAVAIAVAYGFPIKPMDASYYVANGDPNHDYEYGRAPGQPDLKDL